MKGIYNKVKQIQKERAAAFDAYKKREEEEGERPKSIQEERANKEDNKVKAKSAWGNV